MKIGFKRADVIKGGQYEDLYYNQIIIPEKKSEFEKGYYLVEIEEDELPWNWFKNNAANLIWQNVGIFVELPEANKSTPCPSWLPNSKYIDPEDNEEYSYTLEEWAGTYRERLDGSMWLLKATQYGDLSREDFNKLITFLDNNPSAIGMLTEGARELTRGVEYTTPEA